MQEPTSIEKYQFKVGDGFELNHYWVGDGWMDVRPLNLRIRYFPLNLASMSLSVLKKLGNKIKNSQTESQNPNLLGKINHTKLLLAFRDFFYLIYT